MDEAVDVFHHQLAAQADSVFKVRGCHVPVRVVAMATLQPQRHHRKKQLDDRKDAKTWTWKEEPEICCYYNVKMELVNLILRQDRSTY